MKTSETITKLIEALCKAQGFIDSAKKNKKNPHFRSNYADLMQVFEACREALSTHDLAVTQTTRFDSGMHFLETTLFHKSGEWMRSEMLLPNCARPQEMGSALTYFRRYSLMALLGIAPDDDDDGNIANKASDQTITPEQASELEELVKGDTDYKKRILAHFKITSFEKLLSRQYALVKSRIVEYVEKKAEGVKDVQSN